MLGTAGLPHILMRFYTVPDAKTARESVTYATAFIGFFYLLTFVLGFGAMVLVGPGRHSRHRPRRQHGGAASRGSGGRHAVSRIHRGRGVCHDSRGRRGADAVRRGGAVARLCGCMSCGTARPTNRNSFASRGRPRLSWARWQSCWESLSGPERRVHGRAGVRDCRERQFSRRWCCRCSGAASRRVARRRACWSAPLRRCCSDLFLPDGSGRHSGHATAPFPLTNPGLVTIPLSFLVGIVVSLMTPEPDP